ncbi:MAG: tetratricopeptide repeat protein [Rhodoblastus sp.]
MSRGPGLDHDDTLEALAYHSFGAGDWRKAALFAEQAGDKATLAFALDRARTHYKAAIDAMDNMAERGRDLDLHWCLIVNKLGMASIFDPLSLRNDVSLFERAADLAQKIGETDAEARARYWLGYMCYGFGRFREGVVHAQRAAELARKVGDARLIAQIDATLGQTLAAAGRYDEALALIDGAIVTKRHAARPGGGIAIGSAYALSCEASILADRGQFAAADACFDEATALLGGSNHPVSNSMRNWRAVSLDLARRVGGGGSARQRKCARRGEHARAPAARRIARRRGLRALATHGRNGKSSAIARRRALDGGTRLQVLRIGAVQLAGRSLRRDGRCRNRATLCGARSVARATWRAAGRGGGQPDAGLDRRGGGRRRRLPAMDQARRVFRAAARLAARNGAERSSSGGARQGPGRTLQPRRPTCAPSA